MTDSLNRFSLEAVKFNDQMLIGLVAIWLVVIGTAISSVYSQPFSKKQRYFWVFVLICLPVTRVVDLSAFFHARGAPERTSEFYQKEIAAFKSIYLLSKAQPA